VERTEAEAILDGDRETAIGLLLRLDDLVAANVGLVAANERLEARVSELERRLNRSSRNSSLPPSQDPPSVPPRSHGTGSGRKRGGQQGHEGRHRRLVPPEQVDEIVEHWPGRCQRCAHAFVERERVDAAEPSRRQIAELPPIAVRVTEHRLHRVYCPACETVTTAETPAESRRAFGPRLQAAVVTLTVRNRVSRRAATELARELFGVELSTGSVDAIL
jgi:transposase